MSRIKGYLPVRFKMDDFETFLYVKEHGQTNDTLFVVNCPVYNQIPNETLLKCLLGRFGDVVDIKMIDNPRRKPPETSWTTVFHDPGYFDAASIGKKYAHVVYRNAKELKRTTRALIELMESKHPYLTIEKVELQTLLDDCHQQKLDDNDTPLGLQAVVQRYRQSTINLDRETLMQECNRVMEEYEAEHAQQESNNAVDDDGFVTVSYTTTKTKANREYLETTESQRTRRSRKRSRGATKTKKRHLTDFYRFQTKESRQWRVHQLRDQFNADLERIQRRKKDASK